MIENSITSNSSTTMVKALPLVFEIPFFFNNYQGSYYRYEASVANFVQEGLLKRFVLTMSLDFKFNFKVLMSLLYVTPKAKSFNTRRLTYKTAFLFRNSLNQRSFKFTCNTGKLLNWCFFNNGQFKTTLYDSVLTNLYKIDHQLSEACLELRLPSNRYNKLIQANFFNVDNFIASFNSALPFFDISKSIGILTGLTAKKGSFILVGPNAVTTSFFVNSFDKSTMFDVNMLAKLRDYLFVFKNVKNTIFLQKFFKVFNKSLYLGILDFFKLSLKRFFNKMFVNFVNNILLFNLNTINNTSVVFFTKIVTLFSLNSTVNSLSLNILVTKFVYLFWLMNTFSKEFYNVYLAFNLKTRTVSWFKFFFQKSFFNLILATRRNISFSKVNVLYYNERAKGLIYRRWTGIGNAPTRILLYKDFRNFKTMTFVKKRRFNFFLSNFTQLLLYFFRQNFYIFTTYKLDNLLTNPKVLLIKYFKTLKYTTLGINKSLKKKLKKHTIQYLNKFNYLFKRSYFLKLKKKNYNLLIKENIRKNFICNRISINFFFLALMFYFKRKRVSVLHSKRRYAKIVKKRKVIKNVIKPKFLPNTYYKNFAKASKPIFFNFIPRARIKFRKDIGSYSSFLTNFPFINIPTVLIKQLLKLNNYKFVSRRNRNLQRRWNNKAVNKKERKDNVKKNVNKTFVRNKNFFKPLNKNQTVNTYNKSKWHQKRTFKKANNDFLTYLQLNHKRTYCTMNFNSGVTNLLHGKFQTEILNQQLKEKQEKLRLEKEFKILISSPFHEIEYINK